MNVTTLTIVMAAYSNGRVAAIVISVLYRMLTEKVRYGYASEALYMMNTASQNFILRSRIILNIFNYFFRQNL